MNGFTNISDFNEVSPKDGRVAAHVLAARANDGYGMIRDEDIAMGMKNISDGPRR